MVGLHPIEAGFITAIGTDLHPIKHGFIVQQVPTAAFFLDTYTNAAVAYSFRKLRAAYAGSAVRIREDGGNTEADIGFDANGDFDTAAAASHIGANNGFIVTWYDQSGNGDDATQATAANQPAYVASGINSKPSLSFTATSSQSLKTATDAVSIGGTVLSCFAVAYMNSGTDTYGRLVSFLASGQTNDYDNAGSAPVILRNVGSQVWGAYRNNIGLFDGGSLTYGTALSMASIWDGTNHTNYANGTGGTAEASSGTWGSTGTVRIGTDPAATDWDGQCAEIILWAVDQTASVSGIYGNHSTYWGV